MKTVALTAAALLIAAPAFADTVGEGVVDMSGPNAVSMPEQLATVHDAQNLDPATLIALDAALTSDDNLVAFALQSGPETVSTQSVGGDVNGQLLLGIGDDADADMGLSAAVEAYLDEVAD